MSPCKGKISSHTPLSHHYPKARTYSSGCISGRSCFAEETLNYQQTQEAFWTDSKVVLCYIYNDGLRFHVYVANRIKQIRDQTSPEQWKYVDTKSNTADYAHKGLSVQELLNNCTWWNGAEFVWQQFDISDNSPQ